MRLLFLLLLLLLLLLSLLPTHLAIFLSHAMIRSQIQARFVAGQR
jgi:hypothetical protein